MTRALIVVLVAALSGPGEEGWRPLLNGKDLTGWETWLTRPRWNIEVRSITEIPKKLLE